MGNSQHTQAHVPDGVLVYAVGDIHGQLHLLDELLEKIEEDAAGVPADSRVLVFIGDYVDRGPNSAGVIDRLVSGLPEGFEPVFLLGNHEEIMLRFLAEPGILPNWLMNGAEATLRSYDVDAPEAYASFDDFAACRDAFAAALPEAHRAFLENLRLTHRLGDYLFVHAGIRPGVPLANQSRHDLLWIREGFLDSDEDLGLTVVHGHTPGPVPVERANRIGIDTGAWAFGRLTAVRLHGGGRIFLSARQ